MDAATHVAQDLATAIPGLHATAPEPLPFAPSHQIRAFLLQRDHGNLLVYSTSLLGADERAMEDLGGLSRHYLNHHHEALFPSDSVGAPLYVHEADRRPTAKAYRVRATFSKRHTLDEDFEVIPIPGHTPGATAYLWDTGDHRVLFTGDTIYLDGGEWTAAVLSSSDRERYIESLNLLRDLEFDVLAPWAASAGEPFLATTDRADARKRIDGIIDRLRHGEDH